MDEYDWPIRPCPELYSHRVPEALKLALDGDDEQAFSILFGKQIHAEIHLHFSVSPNVNQTALTLPPFLLRCPQFSNQSTHPISS